MYFKAQMSHTVPKASATFSREPGGFSFGMDLWELTDLWQIMKDTGYTPNRIPRQGTLLIKLFQSNIYMCARKTLQKGRNDNHENILESKHMSLW